MISVEIIVFDITTTGVVGEVCESLSPFFGEGGLVDDVSTVDSAGALAIAGV